MTIPTKAPQSNLRDELQYEYERFTRAIWAALMATGKEYFSKGCSPLWYIGRVQAVEEKNNRKEITVKNELDGNSFMFSQSEELAKSHPPVNQGEFIAITQTSDRIMLIIHRYSRIGDLSLDRIEDVVDVISAYEVFLED